MSQQCAHIGEVYYKPESDNYYCRDCNAGMGIPYYKLAKQFEIQVRVMNEAAKFSAALIKSQVDQIEALKSPKNAEQPQNRRSIIMKTGIELIADERQRQVEKEGWTPEHDDAHIRNELPLAAKSYLWHVIARGWVCETEDLKSTYKTERADSYCWPWDESWWKPKNPVQDLVRAGALIAAEIDRLNRLANTKK